MAKASFPTIPTSTYIADQINCTVNATNKVKLQQVASPFTASYFELVVLALLITAILLGNSLVCLAFRSVSRRLKTITNSFVISLAASDILVGAVSLPLWVTLRTG